MLSCPNCQRLLAFKEKAWSCDNGHSFDIGKNGYINLLLPQHKRSKSPGDSKAMVTARRAFLTSTIYQPIAEWVAQFISEQAMKSKHINCIADAGCGEGYYLRHIEKTLSEKAIPTEYIGWDISKFAVQAAAKHSDFGTWITASNAQVPLANSCVDVLFSLFGFAVTAEFSRVLKNGGLLLTVDVGERHLIELRERIYPTLKPYQEKPLLNSKVLKHLKRDTLSYRVTLNSIQIEQLLLMTPHFFRVKPDKLQAVNELLALDITVDVVFHAYQQVTG